ncbi:MAG: GAF domain-containing protein [Catalinimonas sp.]
MSPTKTPQAQDFLREVYARTYADAEQYIQYAVGAMFAFGMLLAFFYDTWLVAAGVGGSAVGAYLLTRFTMPQSALHRYVTSVALGLFGVQFIYQMHGLFEMHFILFIIATVIIFYEDWRVYVPVTLLVVVHHTAFAYLQNVGYSEVYFSQLDYVSLRTLAFHYGLFVVQVVICAGWSHINRRRSERRAAQQHRLEQQLRFSERNLNFADQIAAGRLDTAYEGQAEDVLGAALVTMRDSLKEAAAAAEQRSWISGGLTELNETVRRHNEELDTLADHALRMIVRYLDVNQGALYLLDGDGEPTLVMRACYAYGRRKHQESTVDPGEGLVGQCFLEGAPTYLTEVPEGYVNITSGLGEAAPRVLLLTPLTLNEQTVGVIELASFQPLSEHAREFLVRAAEVVASTVVSTRNQERTQRLLEQSQELMEQMRAQEEEMRQNLEELQATQEALERRQSEQVSA